MLVVDEGGRTRVNTCPGCDSRQRSRRRRTGSSGASQRFLDAAQLAGVESPFGQLVAVIRADRRSWQGDATTWPTGSRCTRRAGPRQATGDRPGADELPHLAVAFREGRIGWDRVRLLAEFADADSDERLSDGSDGPRSRRSRRWPAGCGPPGAVEENDEAAASPGTATSPPVAWSARSMRRRWPASRQPSRSRPSATATTPRSARPTPRRGSQGRGKPTPLPPREGAAGAGHDLLEGAGAEAEPDRACAWCTPASRCCSVSTVGRAGQRRGHRPDTVRLSAATGGSSSPRTRQHPSASAGPRRVPPWLARQVPVGPGLPVPGAPQDHPDPSHQVVGAEDRPISTSSSACRKHHRLLHEVTGSSRPRRRLGHLDRSRIARYTSALPGLRPKVAARITAMLPFPVPTLPHPHVGVAAGLQRHRRPAPRTERRRSS